MFKYNPFSNLYTDSDSTKFYDIEPSDVIDSTKKISSILDKCSLYTTHEVNQLFSHASEGIDQATPVKFSSYFLNIDGNKTNFDNFACELETFSE